MTATQQAPPAVSLFSNCGAGDYGYSSAGFSVRVLAEIVEKRMRIATMNHPNAEAVTGDLRETWCEVVDAYRDAATSAPPSLISACPPCQGMSSENSDRGAHADKEAGGSDGRNLLVLPIARVAQELEPRIIVVENVRAFLTRHVPHPDTAEALSAAVLLLELLNDDYRAYPLLVDLAEYGIPQRRTRAFLTFVRRGTDFADRLEREGLTPYPEVTHGEGDDTEEVVALGDFLSELEVPALDAAPGAGLHESDEEPLHTVPEWKAHHYDMIAAIPPGSGRSAWQNETCKRCGKMEVGQKDATCPECGDPLLRPVIEDEDGYRLIYGFRDSSYRRQDPDRPANTITTASAQLGSSSTIHPSENRVLSALECARLQTIPADFDWGEAPRSSPGITPIRAMIGEAVPPLFTEKHGRVLLAGLQGENSVDLLKASDERCRRAIADLRKGGLEDRPNLDLEHVV